MNFNFHRRYFLPLFLLSFLACFSGCALVAGTMDSVRKAGLTPKSRESLLSPAVMKFNESIGWGDISMALSMTTELYKDELRTQLLKEKGKIKVIDTVVDLSEFEDSAFKATVFVTRRAYTIPFYIAESFKLKQKWAYSLTSGWQIDDQELMEDEG